MTRLAEPNPDVDAPRPGRRIAPTEPDRRRLVAADEHAAVVRYLRLLGCSCADAEDLAQDAIVVALRSPSKAPTADRHERVAWLRTTARRRWIDAVRRRRVRLATDVATHDPNAWADAVDRLVATEPRIGEPADDVRLDALRTCRDELSPRVRRALALFYDERRSRAEVGRELAMHESGVKTLLQRARRALRACIERRLAAEATR